MHGSRKLTKEILLERVKRYLGNDIETKIDFSEVPDIIGNNKVKIPLRCVVHNEKYSQISLDLCRGFTGCSLCKEEKKLRTNMEKYGVAYPVSLSYVQDKVKKANLERYGIANTLNVFRRKTIKSLYEKYRDDPYFQDKTLEDIILDETFNISKLFAINEKKVQTYIEKYGATSYIGSDVGKEAVAQTNLDRYGFKYASQNPDIKKKMMDTKINEYYRT